LTLGALLERLRAERITLRAADGRLHFEAPRGVMTEDLRHAIAAHRPELVALLCETESGAIARGSGDGPWPLSFAQRRLWFVEQLPDLGPAYTICGAARIEGALDAEALAAATALLAVHHPILRTGIALDGDEPLAFLEPDAALHLEILDLTHLPATDRNRRSDAALAEFAAHRFDLARPPLARALLVRLEDEHHLLALAQHHIVTDGWTISLLLRELSRLYAAVRTARLVAVDEHAPHYGDFARWQQSDEQRPVLEAHVAAACELLHDAPGCVEIPADRPRPQVQSFRGAIVRGRLEATLASGLQSLAQSERATTFMALLALVTHVLQRYCGTEDLVIGTAVAGRDRPELTNVAGLFVNTVPIRMHVAAGIDGHALLRAAREAALTAFEHQAAPFERIVEAIAPDRDPRIAPVCQVFVALQNALTDRLEFEGARVTPVRVENATCKVDLFLSADEAADGAIDLELEYCTDLFEQNRMERLLRHLEALARAIVADPTARIDRHDLRDAAERAAIAHWNETTRPLPSEASVHALFSAVAAQRSGVVAVIADDSSQQLCYEELEERAARLAAALGAAGVRPGDVVAVQVPRSPSLAVALLGVLRAGAAYLPLDADRPEPRVAEIIADARPRAIVADIGSARSLDPGIPIVDPGKLPAAGAAAQAVDLDACAYVMYTSGSTGEPKGVRVTHRNILRLVGGLELDAEPHRAILHAAPISFDASTFELWGALLTGRTLVMAPPGAFDTSELAATIARRDVGTVWLTAGLFHRMVEEHLDVLARLTLLYGGGDVLSPHHVQLVLDRMAELGNANGRVVNGYGPTECTTFTTLHVMRAGTTIEAPVPIGKPIANTTLHVVDRYGLDLPVGIPGELLVGGDGVALGYLGDSRLTNERFTGDPGHPGKRRYHTGDLVRWRNDGTLEFIGRLDQQIKIRGFRVELTAIESALLAQPGVCDAVAIADESQGTRRILAYIRTDGTPDTEDLFDALAVRLPDYMLPAAITIVPALALTKNGKLDREALPAPVPFRRPDGGAPHNLGAAGEALAAIWREALDVATIEAQDNFFRSGGDSLIAMRLVSSMARAGWQISIRDVLAHQRFGDLARAARRLPAASPETNGAASAAPVLTPVQRAFFERSIARPDHWNQALLLEAVDVDACTVAAALDVLVARHDALRQRFSRAPDGSVSVRIAPHAAVTLQRVDLRLHDAAQACAVQARCSAELQGSLDLENGPLVAAAWFERDGCRPQLLLSAHHLCVDAASWATVVDEIAASARGVPLPAPQLTFAGWSSRLAALAPAIEGELAAYDDWPATPRLPGGEESRADEARVRTQTIVLDTARTSAFLHGASDALGSEPTELLLAAVAHALAAWAQTAAVRIDVERHGRDAIPDLDASGIVGWFTALVPLRISCAGDVLDVHDDVKRCARDLPRRGVGWGVLRYLAPDPAVRAAAAAVGAADCSVNFLGTLARTETAALIPVDGELGPLYAPGASRSHAFEVVALVEDRRLRIDLRYDAMVHGEAGPSVARGIESALRDLIDRARDAVVPAEFMKLANGAAEAAPIVIVPGSSGNAAAYLPLAERLPGRTVFGLHFLGIAPPWSVGDLADRIVDAFTGRAVTLVGHSFGAAVALEAARTLASLGAPPAALVLVDLPAPPNIPLVPYDDDVALRAAIADAIARFTGRMVDRAEFDVYAAEMVEGYRTSLRALAEWDPQPFELPAVTIVRAEESEATAQLALDDAALGWRRLFPHSEIACWTVPGDHITMIADAHVDAFAALLNRLP
jgi:amino acid adenylation domain-containing protein/non-ribosomal peptide synthase protein (TIGR01720 family)